MPNTSSKKPLAWALLCASVALLASSSALSQDGSAHASAASASPPCAIAKTNGSCTLTIDRKNPLAPPTIQMYPKSVLTVKVQNPYYFERYFMDYTSGQLALSPDVASTITGGLLAPLKNFQVHAFDGKNPPPLDCSPTYIVEHTPKAATGDMTTVTELYGHCLADFIQKSRELYLRLEPMAYPDAHSAEAAELASTNFKILCASGTLAYDIDQLAAKEIQLSNSIGSVGKLATSDKDARPLSVTNATLEKLVASLVVADAIAKDLTAYRFRLEDLPSFPDAVALCANPEYAPAKALNWKSEEITLFPLRDPRTSDPKLVTRQVTYAIDALNLVTNAQEAVPSSTTKKPIASITVLYGDSKWEASAGTFFSSLAVRSFGASRDSKITQNVLHPTVVPFAAANYRVSNDLSWTKWRSAIYLTGAIGVNPNTVSADFGAGPSISWRG